MEKRDSAMFVWWHMIETVKCTSLYWLVRDRYSPTFQLLGVSSPWLLLAVSLTRHFPL